MHNPDVAAAGVDPLEHYLRSARPKGARPMRRSARPSSAASTPSTICCTIPTWRRPASIRCSTSTPSAGTKGAIRTPCSTPPAISRTTPTCAAAGVNPLSTTSSSAGTKGRDPSARLRHARLSGGQSGRRGGARQPARSLPQFRHLRGPLDLRRRHLALTRHALGFAVAFALVTKSPPLASRRTVLEDQDPRRMSAPSGRACATAAAAAACSSSRTRTTAALLHRYRLPAARRRDLPLRRLRQPHRAGAGLRGLTPTTRAARLAAADLRLPPGRRGPGSLLVASAGLRRSRHRARGRRLGARPRLFRRGPVPEDHVADHIVSWPTRLPKGAKRQSSAADPSARRPRRRPRLIPKIFLERVRPPSVVGVQGRRPPCPPSPTPPSFQPRSEVPPELWPGRLLLALRKLSHRHAEPRTATWNSCWSKRNLARRAEPQRCRQR